MKQTLHLILIITIISIFNNPSPVSADSSLKKEPSVECIENAWDAEEFDWSVNIARNAEYPEDLPEPLTNKLEGRGMIYWEGGYTPQKVYKYGSSFNAHLPIYLYVKYYAHETHNSDKNKYIFPTPEGDGYLLPTTNFTWAEAMFQLDLTEGATESVGVETNYLWGDEYLVIEKMILSQGHQVETIEDIKNLCPPRVDVGVECVDDLEDFETFPWKILYSTFLYAQDSSALPIPTLQENLEGNGIFYWEGGDDAWQQIQRYPEANLPSVYVYFKYYGYTAGLTTEVTAWPVIGGPTVIVNKTHNFEWSEVYFPLSISSYRDYTSLTTRRYRKGDYFLVDKIIVAQGYRNISSLEDIKNLCPSKEVTGTTVNPTTVDPDDPSTTTTTGKPGIGDFECKEIGSFGDSYNCYIFHVCQLDDNGNFYDTVMTCPGKTVWCEDTKRCDTQVVCPCSVCRGHAEL